MPNDVVDSREGQALIAELMRQGDWLVDLRKQLATVTAERDALRKRLDEIVAFVAATR